MSRTDLISFDEDAVSGMLVKCLQDLARVLLATWAEGLHKYPYRHDVCKEMEQEYEEAVVPAGVDALVVERP